MVHVVITPVQRGGYALRDDAAKHGQEYQELEECLGDIRWWNSEYTLSTSRPDNLLAHIPQTIFLRKEPKGPIIRRVIYDEVCFLRLSLEVFIKVVLSRVIAVGSSGKNIAEARVSDLRSTTEMKKLTDNVPYLRHAQLSTHVPAVGSRAAHHLNTLSQKIVFEASSMTSNGDVLPLSTAWASIRQKYQQCISDD